MRAIEIDGQIRIQEKRETEIQRHRRRERQTEGEVGSNTEGTRGYERRRHAEQGGQETSPSPSAADAASPLCACAWQGPGRSITPVGWSPACPCISPPSAGSPADSSTACHTLSSWAESGEERLMLGCPGPRPTHEPAQPGPAPPHTGMGTGSERMRSS